ncbi:MAG TPA: DUF2723 domain-containing protein [Blastocatellia bacterium]|nr:DUF2723 domain-containing protein [Blastocatellia bacterium]
MSQAQYKSDSSRVTHSRWAGLLPLSVGIVFVSSLALYYRTLAPTVALVDSGELIVAAETLGVAHPPGFPVYVLLAHFATLIPVGSVAVRVNFASALFAALTVATLTWIVGEAAAHASVLTAIRQRSARKTARGRKAKRIAAGINAGRDLAAEQRSDSATLVPAVAAGLMFACSRTFWSYATVAEVYTLNTLLLLLVFALLFRWRRGHVDPLIRPRPEAGLQPSRPSGITTSPRPVFLYAAAFIFGLGMCVHHVTVGLALPAMVALVLATEGRRFFVSRRLLYAALSSLAGLAAYAYLPLAASRSPIMNWGDPRTLERLWWHVSGRQYQTYFEYSPRLVAEFIRFTSREFGPIWMPLALVLALAGVVALFQRDRVLLLVFGLVIAFNVGFGLHYGIDEDKDAYYLPTFLVLAMAAGFGAQWVVLKVGSLELPRRVSRLAVPAVLLVLVVPAIALASNFGYNDRGRYFIARDYVQNILSTVEPDGMLLTGDWQVYSPMLYLRHVEGVRRDVTAIDITLLRRSWYFDYLKREYPELMESTRDEVDAFLEDLTHWDREPEAYARDAALNERINARFYEMIRAFVSEHLKKRAVCVTYDIGVQLRGQDAELTKSLSTYQLVPQGLVFQLFTGRGFREPAEPALTMRGLADGSIKFEDDSVVRRKVLPVYVDMLVNRGRYLAAHDRHARAIELFKEALALDPNSRNAQLSLAESLSAPRPR